MLPLKMETTKKVFFSGKGQAIREKILNILCPETLFISNPQLTITSDMRENSP